jgi:predicted glycosyltransferase
MRIIVDIGHPGHVHFFKNFIWSMRNKGHEILITASKKDVTLELLDAYGLEYAVTSKRYSGLMLGYELLKRDLQLYAIAGKFKPDFIVGINNTIAAHVSMVTKAKSIIFTDTEHAKIANAITFPFSDAICTPSCYRDNIGLKQIRYNGYHELAYLHPNRFTPNPAVLDELGLSEGDRFIIVRFVSWGASHDVGHHGICDKVGLVKALEQYGRVIITSEGELPLELQPYQMRVSPEKLHDLLYYATLYVGEGATTASECAVLGTHAIYVNTLRLGYIAEEAEKYGLVSDFSTMSCTDETVLAEVNRLLGNPCLWEDGKQKVKLLLQDKIDVTAFMVWFVENYPGSVDKMKTNPELQNMLDFN